MVMSIGRVAIRDILLVLDVVLESVLMSMTALVRAEFGVNCL